MAEIFYSDKSKIFECVISVEGASLSNSQARLKFNFDNINYLFEGDIASNGKCKIKVPALRNAPNAKGEISLEVIADETYFEPWTSNFNIKRSKNVTVEIKSSSEEDKKPVITVKTKKVSQSLYKENISETNKKVILEIARKYKDMSKTNKSVMDMIAENHHASNPTIKDAKKIFNDITLPLSKLYMYFVDSAKKQ